jgi:hypothetical protein
MCAPPHPTRTRATHAHLQCRLEAFGQDDAQRTAQQQPSTHQVDLRKQQKAAAAAAEAAAAAAQMA